MREIKQAVDAKDYIQFLRALKHAVKRWRASGGLAFANEKRRDWIKAWKSKWGEPPQRVETQALEPPKLQDRGHIVIWPRAVDDAARAEAAAEGSVVDAASTVRRLRPGQGCAETRNRLKNAVGFDRFDPGVRKSNKEVVLKGRPQLDGEGRPRIVAREFAAVGAAMMYNLTDADRRGLEAAGAEVIENIRFELPKTPTSFEAAGAGPDLEEAPDFVALTRAAAYHARGRKGAGALIAVLDTGLDKNFRRHPAFKDVDMTFHAVYGANRHRSRQVAHDVDAARHGTGVASVAARMAPKARFVSIAVFDHPIVDGHKPSATLESVLAGLTIAIKESQSRVQPGRPIPPLIVNLSLGAPSDPLSATFDASFAAIEAQGGVIVAASGNDGSRDRVSWPSSRPRVIAVGAVDFERRPAAFSNSSPAIAKPDLSAYGVDVSCAGRGDETVARRGTSFAAPMVSGAAALMPEAGEAKWRDRICESVAAGAACQRRGRGVLELREVDAVVGRQIGVTTAASS